MYNQYSGANNDLILNPFASRENKPYPDVPNAPPIIQNKGTIPILASKNRCAMTVIINGVISVSILVPEAIRLLLWILWKYIER